MRLWHDDIRRPPDKRWTWARTNTDAKFYLWHFHVTEMSMDHDLGLHDYDPDEQDADLRCLPEGARPEEGWELVQWMIENELIPDKITIHSWNPVGAKRMADMFADIGKQVTVKQYQRPGEGVY